MQINFLGNRRKFLPSLEERKIFTVLEFAHAYKVFSVVFCSIAAPMECRDGTL
jgi:hypothetical protein